MADRFNVRNVAQKEVYDSYMGILRISPNLVYGVDEDDATNMLHTLVDFRKEYTEEGGEIKVQLSDSDGNMLPVYFIPRAFSTEVTLRDNGNNYTSIENIVNICTWTNDTLFVSNNLDVRSTLLLKIKDTQEQKNKSLITIVSGGQKNTIENTPQANAILQYPIENPNDDYFFNKDNNKYPIDNTLNKFLFDANDPTPRHEQMEKNLFNQSLSWYQDVIKKEIDRTGQDPHVKAAGKYVNTFNVHNEDVPVLYTRDYVLGHYEGHSIKGKDKIAAVKDEWLDSQAKTYDVSFDESSSLTRLSWIRIDNLIWDAIDEIASGKIRHSGSGRYVDMGAQNDSGTQIVEELFGIGLYDEGKTELNGQVATNGNNSYTLTAPILGQGVQPGLIMYHAMPFHRYWFHRCRQIIYNMERYSELSKQSAWTSYSEITDEVSDLQTYKNNNLITGSCRASVTPHHSLSKDFLLCNGQTVKFENYPNISLTNTNLLVNDSAGKEAELKNGKFQNRNSGIDSWEIGTYWAIRNSISNGSFIKTPNLFSFNETYPRFIRGLSWDTGEVYVNNKNNPEQIPDYNRDVDTASKYIDNLKSGSNIYWIHSSKFEMDDDDNLTEKSKKEITNDWDIWGNHGINIQKPIEEVGLYHYNYDYSTKKQNHYHFLFSSQAGGSSNLPFNKTYDWSQLAAFYVWGSYGGIKFKVAANESDGTVPFLYTGNEHGSSDYNYGKTYCLALTSNYENNYGINSKDWMDYCLSAKKSITFHDFTPIGNAGLTLWNSDVFNTKGTREKIVVDEETDYIYHPKYAGTTESIENGTGRFYFTTYYTLDLKSEDISKYVTEKVYLTSVGSFKPSSEADATYNRAKEIRRKRFKRKQQAVKLNEAEGRIPISSIGNAKYRLEEGHMIERKRSLGSRIFKGDKYDTEPITVYKNNIGNYTLKAQNLPSVEDATSTENWGWTCLTSLPYEFPEFLGFGDFNEIEKREVPWHEKSHNINCKLSDPTTYYINHNVTDRWKKAQPEEKIQIIKYGGVSVKSDIQSPTPSHLYLLPLIRL